MLEPACEWHPAACAGGEQAPPGPFGLYGVFDGHGGKAAAEACVAHMLPELLAALVRLARVVSRGARSCSGRG